MNAGSPWNVQKGQTPRIVAGGPKDTSEGVRSPPSGSGQRWLSRCSRAILAAGFGRGAPMTRSSIRWSRHVRSRNWLALAASVAMAAAFLSAPASVAETGPGGPELLDGAAHPKWVNELPQPLGPGFVFTEASPGHYEIYVAQVKQNVLGPGFPSTTVWGYGNAADPSQPPTYPGRTFVVRRGHPITVQWSNRLVGPSGKPLPHLFPIDRTVEVADPPEGVPITPHLHGGHVE